MKKITLITLLLYTSLLVLTQNSAYIEGKISPYTVHFISSYEKQESDSVLQAANRQRYRLNNIRNTEYINAFIELNNTDEYVFDILKDHDVEINSIIGKIITARIPANSIETLALYEEIKYLEIALPVYKKMNKARVLSNVDEVRAGTDLDFPYLGKDVVIGIIDNGFEYGHINFYNAQATEFRVKRVWDQNTSGNTQSPAKYNYGTEYKTQEEILSAQYDYKTETHGTHVAGIAGGADIQNNNIYYGIASESDLVFVSFNDKTDNVGITDGIKYIYDYAKSVNKPCVINLSLGTHIGPHDGSSTFDRLCDELQGEGKLLVGAVGNEGADKLHLSKSFTPTDNSLNTFFGFYENNELFGLTDIWGEAGIDFTVSMVIYNRNTGEEIFETDLFNTANTYNNTYTLNTSTHGARGNIQISTGKDKVNKKSRAMAKVELSSLKLNHYVGLKITANGGTVHAWTDDIYSYFTGNNIEGWTAGNSDYSMGEIGGTGNKIISVGAYTSNNQYYNQPLQNITTFSSYGPTMDGRLKPEITAPGSAIISSFSNPAVTYGDYGNNVVKTSSISRKNYYYGVLQGTSMAAPQVTGILASWLEAKKNLSPEEAKRILQKTAIQDLYTGEIASTGDQRWGYGKINALEGLKECISMQQTEERTAPGINVYKKLSEPVISLMFSENDSNMEIHISNSNGRILYTGKFDDIIKNEIYTIDLSNFKTGLYILKARGSKKTYKSQKFVIM